MQRTAVRRAVMAGAALATALLLAACGGGHDQTPGMHPAATTPAGGGTSSAAAFNNADVMFAQMMIPHHQQAVQMAALADTRAADPEVKTLAGQIKAAQDPEIQTMQGWLTAWGKPAPAMSDGMGGMDHGAMPGMSGPSAMPGMMSDADMARLRAASGKDFDKQFCTMMIAHHQGAITMANQELANGTNADAKALAQQIITAQQAEIATMQKIVARLS
ncbi:DUF305 domain-containing protein [Dactylosporangium sp. NPDC051485]|uniref:DUF305 domain-containing protein n=1 Tax=Dactylosporangium sp. NPDC051485 TaxID=3154846 RepID=UPI0034316D7E